MTTPLTNLYKRTFGHLPMQVVPLRAHASDRKIYRLEGPDRTVIGILNSNRAENLAFVSFARSFKRAGLEVPAIYSDDPDSGAYLEEDLGDVTLHDVLLEKRSDANPFPPEVEALYAKALGDLTRLQIVGGRVADYSVCFQGSEFDRDGLLFDMTQFRQSLLKRVMPDADTSALDKDFSALADFLDTAPRQHFMFRDFQSRNIMVLDDRLAYIDFQGGRRGGVQYDVASLLFQASASVPKDAKTRLIAGYLDALGDIAPLDRDRFLEFFPGFAFARMLQVLGTYGKVGLDGKNEYFTRSIPLALKNLRELRSGDLTLSLPALESALDRLDDLYS